MVRKHCGKKRKCWLPAFSPFPTMFSKGFFFRVVESGGGGGKGLGLSQMTNFRLLQTERADDNFKFDENGDDDNSVFNSTKCF